MSGDSRNLLCKCVIGFGHFERVATNSLMFILNPVRYISEKPLVPSVVSLIFKSSQCWKATHQSISRLFCMFCTEWLVSNSAARKLKSAESLCKELELDSLLPTWCFSSTASCWYREHSNCSHILFNYVFCSHERKEFIQICSSYWISLSCMYQLILETKQGSVFFFCFSFVILFKTVLYHL